MPTAQLYPPTGSHKPANRAQRRSGGRLGKKAGNVGPPPSEDDPKRLSRRSKRYRLRAQLRTFTSLPRITHCGYSVVYGAGGVPLKIAEGVAHFAQLQSCGSPWSCPVCGPKIRQGRAVEINDALQAFVAEGLGVLMLTLTCRHHAGQRLAALLKAQEGAWRRFMQSKPYRRAVREHLVGFIQQREVTHGERNGWHPHRHLALVLDAPMDDGEVEALRAALWPAWLAALQAEGLSAEETWTSPAGEVKHPGLDLRAGDPDGLADYLLKVAGDDSDLAMEMMRGDLKSGRLGRRTPEQILEDFIEGGEVADRKLWNEYEAATKGRKMTTWSHGLRERAKVEEEMTDEELVALEVGGVTLATVTRGAWPLVRADSPGGVDLLRAAEQGTWEAYLDRVVGPTGWYRGPADG